MQTNQDQTEIVLKTQTKASSAKIRANKVNYYSKTRAQVLIKVTKSQAPHNPRLQFMRLPTMKNKWKITSPKSNRSKFSAKKTYSTFLICMEFITNSIFVS